MTASKDFSVCKNIKVAYIPVFDKIIIRGEFWF